MKKRIACLIAGVPSGYKRCVEGLRYLLRDCDTDFYAVIRDEFATTRSLNELHEHFPGLRIIVVPRSETEAALEMHAHRDLLPTVIKMWHEVWYGASAIANPGRYDLLLRTRFDVFFHEQHLPNGPPPSPMTVRIPQQMAWSGCNDMVCLAPPAGFMEYARTFERLTQTSTDRVFVPEMILARSLALSAVQQENLDLNFVLYRDALFSGFSDVQLGVLAYTRPDLSTYKLGVAGDTEDRREEHIAAVAEATVNEARFPLFVSPMNGENLHTPETDERDGTAFRWMGIHGKVRRSISPHARQLHFKIHHQVRGWQLGHLQLLLDGYPVILTAVGEDQYGRTMVTGPLPERSAASARRGLISLGSSFSQVPSVNGDNPSDHRLLSIAIGDFEFA